MMFIHAKKLTAKLIAIALLSLFFCKFLSANAEDIIIEPTIKFYMSGWGPFTGMSLEEVRNHYNPSLEADYARCLAVRPSVLCVSEVLSSNWRNRPNSPIHNGYTEYIDFGFGTNPLSYYGEPRTYEWAGIPLHVEFYCYWPSILTITGPSNDSRVTCIYHPTYSAILTKTFPEPKMCAGNPIDISSGVKIQNEIDIEGLNDLQFSLSYNNNNLSGQLPWINNFQKSIQILDETTPNQIQVGTTYYETKQDACTGGWAKIRTAMSPLYDNTTATYTCDVCEVKRANRLVAILAIVENKRPDGGGNATESAVQLHRENGSVSTFTHVQACGKDEWRSSDGESADDQLSRSITDNSWQLSTQNGVVESYSSEGKLTSITAKDGSIQTMTYDALGQLIRVNSNKGHQLAFGYSADKLASVTVDQFQTTRFGYNATGLINKVIRADNSFREYHYEDPAFPKNLTGITNERGVRFATWKYDTQGRAISSEHADGAEKTTLVFNANGTTTVTNPLNKKTIYAFADILGIKRVTTVTGEPTANCVGANQNYTYNPYGLIDTQTDWKGNITKFEYDSIGREISKTTAFNTSEAATTKTCWHNTLNKPTRIIEPQQITVFDYWPTGQLKTTSTKPRPTGTVDCSTAL